ncbi:MAG: hypothetical protein ACYDIC_14170 [Desulfobaccales bacterium]
MVLRLKVVPYLKAPLKVAARNRLALMRKVNYWDAEHIAAGFLGG